MSTGRWSLRFLPARCLRWIAAGMTAHGTTRSGFSPILDEQRAK